MDFFGFFRRRPPIRNLSELSIFIDEHAAFVVQKGIYEYARARAGHYAKVLLREPEFHKAVEESRWRAYPLGLAMVTELAEGILTQGSAVDRLLRLDALSELTLSVFDRYPIPAAVGERDWNDARTELARRLAQIALHPPKWAKDVPESFAEAYFDLLPIHENLRTRDFPTIKNYLRVTLCNVHDELTKRMDTPALAQMLIMPVG